MSLVVIISFFILGTIIASFVGVVAARLNSGQGIVEGRSKCDACNAELGPLSLIPIFSYFVSGGRARCCGAKVSYVSPLTECALGGLFVLAYLKIGVTYSLPFMLISFSLMLALVLYDLNHQILPPALLAPFVFVSAITGYLSVPHTDFLSVVLMAFALAGVLAIIHFGSGGRAMGFADAPFTFGCALLVGGAALPGFIFSFWIGAVLGIIVLLGRPRGSRIGVEVPFAPYLAAGFILAYFTQWNPFAFAASLFS
jgi:prepilin signal peptidase PulO-like enzyme (type II secretory pathway)